MEIFFGRSISHKPKDDYKKEKRKNKHWPLHVKGLGWRNSLLSKVRKHSYSDTITDKYTDSLNANNIIIKLLLFIQRKILSGETF